MNDLLYYDDIALIADYYDGNSRSDLSTSTKFGNNTFKLPVTPANMKCSIDYALAESLSEDGYFYILHRFYEYDEIKTWITDHQDLKTISISLGIQKADREFIDWLTSMDAPTVDYITIDVAHGHCKAVKEMLQYINKAFDDDEENKPFIIAGNVMTRKATEDLYEWGADAIKVGIGPGSVCSTRLKTGFTYPQFSCVVNCSTPPVAEDLTNRIQMEINDEYNRELKQQHPSMFGGRYCKNQRLNRLLHLVDGDPTRIGQDELHKTVRDEFDERYAAATTNAIPIIADGGISHNGDIAKAIRAGACMTMIGSMFAACLDSPADDVIDEVKFDRDYDGYIQATRLYDLESDEMKILTGPPEFPATPVIKKRYYGSASEENKGTKKNVEGFLMEIPCNQMTVLEKLDEIKMDLQSSISYAGGQSLDSLKEVDYQILR